jgi:undecaprenyl-phosphate 4-deoxy-4-formamido-L-arabinose transferase
MTVLDEMAVAAEIILIDDGSPDDSWQILTALRADYPDRLHIIQLMRNYGQHNALMCGFRHAKGEYIVTLDDDLQTPPEEIPKLWAAIHAENLDLVYGLYQSKQHQRWRNLGSAVVNAFYRTVFRTPVTVSSYRIMRRRLVKSILAYSLNFTFVDGLLAWNTQRIGQTPVAHQPRTRGSSGYSISKLILLALNLFTNFSLLPLQMISACGLLTASLGLLTAIYYLAQYLQANVAVPGYSSIIIAVLVLGGIQLLALGIMGEYLGRLHLNVNHKPQYTERTISGPQVPDSPATSDRRDAA